MSHINGKVYAMNAITPMRPWNTWILRLIFFISEDVKSKQQDLINLFFIEFARWVIIPRNRFTRVQFDTDYYYTAYLEASRPSTDGFVTQFSIRHSG